MSFYAQAIQALLDEFKWDQNGYLVQPSDVHNQLWNLLNYLDFARADIYGNTNGVITGLNVTASTPNMAFAVSVGRCTTLSGQKILALIAPGGSGQPATFTVNPVNGTGMSVGQTRIDLICAQYNETFYQDTNGADRVIEGVTLSIIQGTPGAPGVAPSLPDNSYTALAAITVHYGDTTSAQCVLDTTAAGLRVNFNSLLTLTSLINGLNQVTLQGGSPTPQIGQGGADNISVHGFIHTDSYLELPYITEPSAPAANTVKMYYKSDGNRYIYDPVYGEQLDIPVGVPTMWLSGTLPSGCFWLDGSVFSTATYARLAAITAGAFKTGGESAGQDRLPDARGRAWFGADSFGSNGATSRLGGASQGAAGGVETITQTLAQLASHTHGVTGHSHTQSGHQHNVGPSNGSGGVRANPYLQENQIAGGNQSMIPLENIGFQADLIVTDTQTPGINSASEGIQAAGSNAAINIMNPYVVGTGWIMRY